MDDTKTQPLPTEYPYFTNRYHECDRRTPLKVGDILEVVEVNDAALDLHHGSCSSYKLVRVPSSEVKVEERKRCAEIAETVNDSIKHVGEFEAAILNSDTCVMPLSGGGKAIGLHVFDNLGICVYCAERQDAEGDKNSGAVDQDQKLVNTQKHADG